MSANKIEQLHEIIASAAEDLAAVLDRAVAHRVDGELAGFQLDEYAVDDLTEIVETLKAVAQ